MRWQRSAGRAHAAVERQPCDERRRRRERRVAQVGGDRRRVDHHARVEAVVRVEQRLGAAHRLVQVVAEDARVERRCGCGRRRARTSSRRRTRRPAPPPPRRPPPSSRSRPARSGRRTGGCAGSRPTRGRTSRPSAPWRVEDRLEARDVVVRAARARRRCPRRTRAAGGRRCWPPSAARARPCGPSSARPARRRSRRAACGTGRSSRAPSSAELVAASSASPKNVTNSSASGSPSSTSDMRRYSSFERDSSRIVRSIISTAAGSQRERVVGGGDRVGHRVEVADGEHAAPRQLDERRRSPR